MNDYKKKYVLTVYNFMLSSLIFKTIQVK